MNMKVDAPVLSYKNKNKNKNKNITDNDVSRYTIYGFALPFQQSGFSLC
jgi:hypothetical protein